MTKYVYKPIRVRGFKIIEIYKDNIEFYDDGTPAMQLTLENGDVKVTQQGMCSRITPKIGDYWVIQPDGYEYLNPAAVFEGKFEVADAD